MTSSRNIDSLSPDLHGTSRGRAQGTLTRVLGQPRSNADLQHFVAGLEDGQVAEALVELHLPGPSGAPGTPVLFFQLQFKAVGKRID